MPLSKKITITVRKSFAYKCVFVSLVLKIITINTRNAMSSSYYSKVRSTTSKGVTFLFCLGHVGTLVNKTLVNIIFLCLG